MPVKFNQTFALLKAKSHGVKVKRSFEEEFFLKLWCKFFPAFKTALTQHWPSTTHGAQRHV